MKYHMITTLGKSTWINYFGCLASVYGIGQGSTDEPSKYTTGCKGFAIMDPAQRMKVQSNAGMFVDDATLLHNNGNKFKTPAQQLMTQIQHDAEIWGWLLWVTGSLLELLKSTYFLLIWQFDAPGKPYIVPEEELPPNTANITDANGNTTKLTRVTERKGIKMLGILKAATLKEDDEFKYLMDRMAKYVGATSACPLQPHETWLGYTTV
eukprot:3814802-Ditylum_brightwellii.AAC.1